MEKVSFVNMKPEHPDSCTDAEISAVLGQRFWFAAEPDIHMILVML